MILSCLCLLWGADGRAQPTKLFLSTQGSDKKYPQSVRWDCVQDR